MNYQLLSWNHQWRHTRFEPHRCYKCKQPGHVWKDCPMSPVDATSVSSCTVNLGIVATESFSSETTLTESQLKHMLAEKWLGCERRALTSASQTNVVTASKPRAEDVGDLIHMEKESPSRQCWTLVLKSTTISRSTLHVMHRKLQWGGHELPQLELPTVRLYGKGWM